MVPGRHFGIGPCRSDQCRNAGPAPLRKCGMPRGLRARQL